MPSPTSCSESIPSRESSRMQQGTGSGSSLEREDWEVRGKMGRRDGRIPGVLQEIWFVIALTSSISKDNFLFICNPAVTWELQIVTYWCFNSDILKVPVILVPVFSFLNFYKLNFSKVFFHSHIIGVNLQSRIQPVIHCTCRKHPQHHPGTPGLSSHSFPASCGWKKEVLLLDCSATERQKKEQTITCKMLQKWRNIFGCNLKTVLLLEIFANLRKACRPLNHSLLS